MNSVYISTNGRVSYKFLWGILYKQELHLQQAVHFARNRLNWLSFIMLSLWISIELLRTERYRNFMHVKCIPAKLCFNRYATNITRKWLRDFLIICNNTTLITTTVYEY